MHHLVERANRLLSKANEYNNAIGIILDTLHDEPFQLKLQYLIEIKASSTFITIILDEWHTFKDQLITNVLAMLKMLTSDGPEEVLET